MATRSSSGCGPALAVGALVLGAVSLYVYLLFLFFTLVAKHLFFWGSAITAVVGLLIYFYMVGSTLLWGSGPPDAPSGPEPAYRQYFFRKAWLDARSILARSFTAGAGVVAALAVIAFFLIINPAQVRTLSREADKPLHFNRAALATWPLGLVLLGVALAVGLSGAAVYAVYGLVHLALVAAVCAVAFVTAGAFRLLEYASMLFRRIFLACPHAGCYQRIPLPLYLCPGCGAEHRKLIPGSYGTFLRRCRCGHRLPTLFLLGRSRLPSICPHENCRRPLSSAIGTVRNVHIPVAGGASSGKTSFLMANVVELSHRAAAGRLTLSFPDARHERLFNACQAAFAQGVVVQKTAEFSPDAFLVQLRDERSREALLYMYDPAGELFQGTDELRTQSYYAYTHGLLLLVDAFSLPQVRADLARRPDASLRLLNPCEDRPQDVYDRLVTTLRETTRMGGALSAVPVAVVITKSDACGIEEDIATFTPPPAPKVSPLDRESEAVRAWLAARGEGNLVRGLTQDFKRVRYFRCSALGHPPDIQRAFAPRGVDRPLAWLLQENGLDLNARSSP